MTNFKVGGAISSLGYDSTTDKIKSDDTFSIIL